MSAEIDPRPIAAVLRSLVRTPGDRLLRRWNWKSAILSACVRSALFFAANLGAGVDAARAALVTELVFRGATAGFYGALTQAFREAQPVWAGTLTALIVLPLTAHAIEAFVHWLRGTVRLTESLAASVAFTIVSTSFHLFAMRRHAFIVGSGSASLWSDLARVPALVSAFLVEVVRATVAGAVSVAALLRYGRAVVLRALYRVGRWRDVTGAGRESASGTSASTPTGAASDRRSRSTPTPRTRAR